MFTLLSLISLTEYLLIFILQNISLSSCYLFTKTIFMLAQFLRPWTSLLHHEQCIRVEIPLPKLFLPIPRGLGIMEPYDIHPTNQPRDCLRKANLVLIVRGPTLHMYLLHLWLEMISNWFIFIFCRLFELVRNYFDIFYIYVCYVMIS